MKYLHTMVRVTDLDASLAFYRDALGMTEVRRSEHEAGRFTLVYLAAPNDEAGPFQPQVELTFNWDPEVYTGGRNFGHLAFAVPDIYAACQRLQDHGVTVCARRATAAWPSCARPMTSRSNCCRMVRRWPRPSPGRR